MSDWNWREWTGVVLFVLSFVMFWSILAVPWLDAPVSTRAWLAGALAVGAEVLFWVGVLIAGRDFMRRYREYLSPRKILAWIRETDNQHDTARPAPPQQHDGPREDQRK